MRGRWAVLCSGQGGQHPEMFALTGAASAAEPVFAAAAALLGGEDPRVLVRRAEPAELQVNRTAQVLCCAQTLAAWTLLAPSHADEDAPWCFAGYSVGELAAWGCAGWLGDAAGALRWAARRAELMDAAAAGLAGAGLTACRGLRGEEVARLCRRAGVHVAIVNGPDRFVLGGDAASLAAAGREAPVLGPARLTALPVRVPAHTPLLRAAADRFGAELTAAAPWSDGAQAVGAGDRRTSRRVLAGVDGTAVTRPAEGCSRLAAQLAETVDWAGCLDTLEAAGVEILLELGPGNALTRMAAERLPGRPCRSVEEFRRLDGVRRWLDQARAGG